MEDRTTALWNLSISNTDFEKLEAGFEPDSMDDKWIFSATDQDQSGNISIHIIRSWTKEEWYQLAVKPSNITSGAKIETITWEPSQGGIHTSEEEVKKIAVLLCRCNLGCDFDMLPEYDETVWDLPAARLDTQ
jgi:hypothetical protein